jgi:hypothetical protein
MNKFAILAMVLLMPAFAANAASTHHEKHAALKYHKRPVTSERKHGTSTAEKARHDQQEAPAAPPVTRLPVPPDTFRA